MSACTAGNPIHGHGCRDTSATRPRWGFLTVPVYSACGPGHLGASQTYIGPPVDRPLSDSLPCSVSQSKPQFPVTGVWVSGPNQKGLSLPLPPKGQKGRPSVEGSFWWEKGWGKGEGRPTHTPKGGTDSPTLGVGWCTPHPSATPHSSQSHGYKALAD